MITFDYCSKCPVNLNCCKGFKEESHPNSRIYISSADKVSEAPLLTNKCGKIECNNLSPTGCTLGNDYKPVVCKAYPFFPVMSDGEISLGISAKCPVAASMISEFFSGNKTFLIDNLDEAKKLIFSLPEKDIREWSSKTSKFLITIKLSDLIA